MAIPRKDSLLVTWSTNFNALGTASPTTYGLTAPQMAAYTPLHTAFVTAYQAAAVPGTRSTALVTARNQAKADLLEYARELYGFVQVNTSVSAEDKDMIGVKNRASPSPIGPPEESPAIDVDGVVGRTVRCRIHNGDALKRGKPIGVKGSTVFSYVGATPPGDLGAWKFQGSTNKGSFEIVFDDTVPAGSQVWLTAFWFNEKSQNGPACTPITTYLAGGSVSLGLAA
jgi:hypothetical protein